MIRMNRIGVLVALVTMSLLVLVGLILAQPSSTEASGTGLSPEWTGIVMTRPTGITGNWVVGGLSFQADNNTHLDETHGTLNVGVCATVQYRMNAGSKIATEIASQESFKCDFGNPVQPMKVYSYVNQLPAGFPVTLTGEWVIGDVTYTAVMTTHFEQEYGPFAVGKCAGVAYITGTPPVAVDLETAPDWKCSGIPGWGQPRAVAFGVVQDFPPDLVGTWTVSGTVYTATASTSFEQEHGPFFVGGCVQVEFNPSNMVATEISTEEADKCAGQPAEQKFFGMIESIPTDTLGTWVIGGDSFLVITSTRLDQHHGPLVVGACVGVDYILSGTDKIATEIGAEEMFKCSTGTFTNVAIGKISSFPPALYGTWVITRNGGFTDTFETYTDTQFLQEHGSFATGVCVQIKYVIQDGVNQAVTIQTEEAEHCGAVRPPNLHGKSIVFATIDQFPTGTPPIGLWVIGGNPYSATSTTIFGEEHGPFAVGACVKALYSVVSDTNVLFQVQTKDPNKCIISGTHVFRAFGQIEAFPADLIGDWQVGGITYTTNISTEFRQEHGFFAVGAFVQVRYVLSGTARLARSIETQVAPGAGRRNIIGILQAHDMNDDWSPWVVSGVTYQSDPDIQVRLAGQSAAASASTVAIGQKVALNVYQAADGTLYVTSVSALSQVYLPMVMR
jgi:hypothetical protein